MICTVIDKLTHYDFMEILKKGVKRVTNSMLIIIAGVLLKDFTTVALEWALRQQR
jgi:hypothetical protein